MKEGRDILCNGMEIRTTDALVFLPLSLQGVILSLFSPSPSPYFSLCLICPGPCPPQAPCWPLRIRPSYEYAGQGMGVGLASRQCQVSPAILPKSKYEERQGKAEPDSLSSWTGASRWI